MRHAEIQTAQFQVQYLSSVVSVRRPESREGTALFQSLVLITIGLLVVLSVLLVSDVAIADALNFDRSMLGFGDAARDVLTTLRRLVISLA